MTADVLEQKSEGTDLIAAFRAAAPSSVSERRFWLTLAIAVLAHGTLLAIIARTPPLRIGDSNAAPGAVSVSFVSEAELQDQTTGSEGGAAASAQQPLPQGGAAPQPEQQPAPAQPEAQPVKPSPAEAKPEKPQEVAKAEVEKAEVEKAPEVPTLPGDLPAEAAPQERADEAVKKREETEKSETAEKTQQELTKENPDLLALPEYPDAPTKKSSKTTQKQAMRSPDMTLPGQKQNMMTSLDGRSAGIERPAGITRSGANDEFARGVIKALRQTMPQMEVLGRLTVRIIINMNGNIESVEIVNRSENSDLNRAVVFSTKQASFPFPPNGATLADRTFTITYIYH
jgi:protein TonB